MTLTMTIRRDEGRGGEGETKTSNGEPVAKEEHLDLYIEPFS